MQVTIDIGNTRVKLAYFEGRELQFVDYFDHEDGAAINDSLHQNKPDNGIISSTASVEFQLDVPEDLPLTILSQSTDLPISLDYQEETLGLDRIANATAIWAQQENTVLAIDLGTCITYNHVRGDRFIGGSISPGLHMRLKAMHTFTGRLPLIEDVKQVNIMADNTEDSLLSGAFHGMRMELDAYLDQFYGEFPDAKAFLTGGDALLFAKALKNPIFADPILTLKGLNEILLYQAV